MTSNNPLDKLRSISENENKNRIESHNSIEDEIVLSLDKEGKQSSAETPTEESLSEFMGASLKKPEKSEFTANKSVQQESEFMVIQEVEEKNRRINPLDQKQAEKIFSMCDADYGSTITLASKTGVHLNAVPVSMGMVVSDDGGNDVGIDTNWLAFKENGSVFFEKADIDINNLESSTEINGYKVIQIVNKEPSPINKEPSPINKEPFTPPFDDIASRKQGEHLVAQPNETVGSRVARETAGVIGGVVPIAGAALGVVKHSIAGATNIAEEGVRGATKIAGKGAIGVAKVAGKGAVATGEAIQRASKKIQEAREKSKIQVAEERISPVDRAEMMSSASATLANQAAAANHKAGANIYASTDPQVSDMNDSINQSLKKTTSNLHRLEDILKDKNSNISKSETKQIELELEKTKMDLRRFGDEKINYRDEDGNVKNSYIVSSELKKHIEKAMAALKEVFEKMFKKNSASPSP